MIFGFDLCTLCICVQHSCTVFTSIFRATRAFRLVSLSLMLTCLHTNLWWLFVGDESSTSTLLCLFLEFLTTGLLVVTSVVMHEVTWCKGEGVDRPAVWFNGCVLSGQGNRGAFIIQQGSERSTGGRGTNTIVCAIHAEFCQPSA